MTVCDLSLCPVPEVHSLEELDVVNDLNQDNKFNIQFVFNIQEHKLLTSLKNFIIDLYMNHVQCIDCDHTVIGSGHCYEYTITATILIQILHINTL